MQLLILNTSFELALNSELDYSNTHKTQLHTIIFLILY